IRDFHVTGVQTCSLPISTMIATNCWFNWKGKKAIVAGAPTCRPVIFYNCLLAFPIEPAIVGNHRGLVMGWFPVRSHWVALKNNSFTTPHEFHLGGLHHTRPAGIPRKC